VFIFGWCLDSNTGVYFTLWNGRFDYEFLPSTGTVIPSSAFAQKHIAVTMPGNVKVESNNGGDTTERPPSSSSPPPPGFSSTANGSSLTGSTPHSHAWSPSDAPSPSSQLLWASGGNQDDDDGRSSSFNNLAAALGSGLAESMEDATRGDHKGGGEAAVATPGLTDNFFNPANDLTYERHKRHAASRLLGVNTEGSSSHKSPEAGSLFGSAFDKGNNTSGGLYGARDGHTSSLAAAAAAASLPHDPNAPVFRPSYDPKSSAYDGNKGRGDNKSRLPVTKDLGLTVMEPSDSPFRGRPGDYSFDSAAGKTSGDGMYGIERGMQNLWSEPGGVARSGSRSPARPDGAAVAVGGANQQFETPVDAAEELRGFTWDINHHEPSRTLAILRALTIPPNEIRSLCESFGVVEAFRSDFLDRGVVFVSFFDMRCAQFAAMQLPTRLQRMGPGSERVQVKFCVPLNSSSQNDESLVVINDLPPQVSADNLAQMLSSFGAIRSLKNLGGSYGGSSFVVEYHDVQDAKQVVLELESTQPWGPNVSVEVGTRNPSDRKKGRELLALLGRWRGRGGAGAPSQSNRGRQPGGVGPDGIYRPHGDPRGMGPRDPRYDRGMPPGEPHLVLGPDGRYTYGTSYAMPQSGGYPQYGGMAPHHHGDHGVPPGSGGYASHHHQSPPPPHHQQHYYAPPQRSHFSGGSSVMSGGSHHSGHRSAPAYFGDDRSLGSHRSAPTHMGSVASGDGNQHLMLDLDAVENGLDTRTSLMVRNIPNKYTQQMLLSEFTENGHGPGVIDFFYLPIDFKNRCNRGYAFINFVDFKDILMFHRQYYGKHWRTFNSDKICDITYARIQGKAAMLKRFENSALMEKDEEYKPLVFVSNGPDKGKRLPFPDSSNKTSS